MMWWRTIDKLFLRNTSIKVSLEHKKAFGESISCSGQFSQCSHKTKVQFNFYFWSFEIADESLRDTLAFSGLLYPTFEATKNGLRHNCLTQIGQ